MYVLVKRMGDKVVVIDDGKENTTLELENGETIDLSELDELVKRIWEMVMEKY